MEEIRNLYIKTYGSEPGRIESLTASASPRRYYRVYDRQGLNSVIATTGTSSSENEAFIFLSSHFRSKGLPVPGIHGVSDNRMVYIQDDCGDITLWDAVASGRKNNSRYTGQQIDLLKQAMSDLADFQYRGSEHIDWGKCYQQMTFGRRSILFDLHYFKYCFLKPSGIEFDENRLEDEFDRMADILTREASDRFLYRDFQPRNIMYRDGRLTYIDYQGGRRGPVHYDVASFVWQAAAEYPDELRKALINTYLTSLRKYEETDEEHFLDVLQHFVIFRTLQVLAAYGYRGLYEGKVRFQMSIPAALRNLTSLFTEKNLFLKPVKAYPYLALLDSTSSERERVYRATGIVGPTGVCGLSAY